MVNEQASTICGGQDTSYSQLTERDISQICERMAQNSVAKLGSRDNVTVEIAFFTGANGYSAQSDAVLDEESPYVSYYGSGAGAKEVENRENYRGVGPGGKDFLSSVVDSLESPSKQDKPSSSNYSTEESKTSSVSASSKATAEFDDDDLMDFLNDDSNF